MLFACVILSLCMYYECFCFKPNNNFSLVCKWVLPLKRIFFFACAELCSPQVMGSTRISSLHMVSKAMTGPLMNLRSTTMKEVTIVLL